MLQDVDLFLYTFFGALTIALSSVVALTFIRSKELRQHPSGLIMSIAICEVIMSYHSIIFAWGSENYVNSFALDMSLVSFGIGHKKSVHLICGSNQIILSAATVACICYNIAICVDLTLTLFNPLIPGHVRKNWYHGIIALSVVYFTIFVNVKDDFVDDCDSTNNNRLEILNSASVSILLIVYLCFALISIFYSLFRFTTGFKLEIKKTREYFIRHVLYVVIFIFCWACPAVSYLMKKRSSQSTHTIDTIAIGSTSISGFLLGIVRLSESSVRKKIFFFSFKNKNKEEETNCEAWNQPVSVIVQSYLNKELALCVFQSLHQVFNGLRNNQVDMDDDVSDSQFKTKDTKTVAMENEKKGVWGVKDLRIEGMIVNFYASEVFLGIIRRVGWTLDDILNSLSPENNKNIAVDSSEGKSGSFFLFTKDKKLSIKTISRTERKLMMKILKDYANHIHNFEDTLLCKIFGLFSINIPGVTVVDVMLMENVFRDFRPNKVYDIKGSTSGRTSRKNGEVKGAFKDLDFIDFKDHLLLSDNIVNHLKAQVLNDIKLLKRNRLMDYSMLIGFSESELDQDKLPKNTFKSIEHKKFNTVYTLAIIDFLTEYGVLKSLERNWAALKFGKKVKKVSVANPTSYSNRFYNFFFSVVMQVMNRNSSYMINDEIS
jgi:hypothetical protein